jgi:hypothetical protein
MITVSGRKDEVKLEDLNKQAYYLCGLRGGQQCTSQERQNIGKFNYCTDKGFPCNCRAAVPVSYQWLTNGISPNNPIMVD